MNRILPVGPIRSNLAARLHALTAHAWLRFVQSLNAIAIAIAGGALVVHETYPDVVRSLLGKLPPELGAGALFLFGTVVHYGLRRAKVEAAAEKDVAARIAEIKASRIGGRRG